MNGSVQREWMRDEDASSPTVITESVSLTAAIEAKEDRHVVTLDIPNTFIQTPVEATDKNGDRYIMKIRGEMVRMLCLMDPDIYEEYVVCEGKQPVLNVHIITMQTRFEILYSAYVLLIKRKALQVDSSTWQKASHKPSNYYPSKSEWFSQSLD